MPLIKVISGGQTGADQAGLIAAKMCSLDTGGWAPKGWLTNDGAAPWLGSQFGLVQHPSDKYPPRTEANVKDADATFRIAYNFGSPGEKCTLKAIKKFKKPHLDVPVTVNPRRMCSQYVIDFSIDDVIDFIDCHDVNVLNVAGNRQLKNGELFTETVRDFLMVCFTAIIERRHVMEHAEREYLERKKSQ